MKRIAKLAIVLYVGLCFEGVAQGVINPSSDVADRLVRTLDAVWAVESGRRLNPPDGDNDNAVGPLQIWKIRVDDANRIIGHKQWTYDDRRDWMKSAEIFCVTSLHYWPNGTPEQWARAWNGNPKTGPIDAVTLGYWEKVKKHLK